MTTPKGGQRSLEHSSKDKRLFVNSIIIIKVIIVNMINVIIRSVMIIIVVVIIMQQEIKVFSVSSCSFFSFTQESGLRKAL